MESTNGGSGRPEPIDIRKYSNRRYYDASRSRHVTLEEIHAMICDGHEIRVTDAKTGVDITAKVLAQIILERDPPKLEVFPVPLLHRLIRANERLVRDFVEKYFNQALSSFLQSQRAFEAYLRRMMGLPSEGGPPAVLDLTRTLFGPFATPFWQADPGSKTEERRPVEAEGGSDPDLRGLVEDLRRQVASLQAELDAKRRKGRRRGR